MLKRIICSIITALMLTSFWGCSNQKPEVTTISSTDQDELTGNVFLDAKISAFSTVGGGIANVIYIDKSAAVAAGDDAYSVFLSNRLKIKHGHVETFTINFEDHTGIIYYGCDPINAQYGKTDSRGNMLEAYGYIMPNDDGTYHYVGY